MYILIIIAAIYTYTQNHKFLSVSSIVNIIFSVSCKYSDRTWYRRMYRTDRYRPFCWSSCRSDSMYFRIFTAVYGLCNKDVPESSATANPGSNPDRCRCWWYRRFRQWMFVAQFKLHPFIVTLATQLITYGVLLLYIMINGNNGQPLSGLDNSFKNFVTGSLVKFFGVPIPNYVWYAIIMIAFMWFMWNKTTFGKNMFAVGSNPEAANVSGVSVFWTTIAVHTLAGAMYGITGFIESARIGSNQANTGLNYECDAIAACVIGGVSFVGGTGKISGIVLGVFILRIIFVALQFL